MCMAEQLVTFHQRVDALPTLEHYRTLEEGLINLKVNLKAHQSESEAQQEALRTLQTRFEAMYKHVYYERDRYDEEGERSGGVELDEADDNDESDLVPPVPGTGVSKDLQLYGEPKGPWSKSWR